jgi:hypothetical protein
MALAVTEVSLFRVAVMVTLTGAGPRLVGLE